MCLMNTQNIEISRAAFSLPCVVSSLGAEKSSETDFNEARSADKF